MLKAGSYTFSATKLNNSLFFLANSMYAQICIFTFKLVFLQIWGLALKFNPKPKPIRPYVYSLIHIHVHKTREHIQKWKNMDS